MVMFKIRDNKLYTTVQNRSNDLHWGLTVNVQQFSFISEIIATILGIELGAQIHNSQSLHFYLWNETAKSMYENYKKNQEGGIVNVAQTVYNNSTYSKMDFSWYESDIVEWKLKGVDVLITRIIGNLQDFYEGRSNEYLTDIEKNVSKYFTQVYNILRIYIEYKKKEKNDENRLRAFDKLCTLDERICSDYLLLAKNWFVKRMANYHVVENKILGTL